MCSTEEVNSNLKPLEQWYCDECGEVIENVDDGLLEWYRDVHADKSIGKGKGYRIVHYDDSCKYNTDEIFFQQNQLTADKPLKCSVGEDGLVYLLSKIQYDYVESNAEFVEIIRRLHVSYYEEARRYHSLAESDGYFDGEDERTRYTTGTSKSILNNYKEMY